MGYKKESQRHRHAKHAGTQEKTEEIGRSTVFIYHGHVVNEAKLQRAEKSYKTTTSSNAGEVYFSRVCLSTLIVEY